ncbi:DUF4268 domain-containing protein [Amycolatopsis sp.]|uniref:DUF4268 domain-containing protein n=1 Tax=Amycolatopsis sp. TaxID=37632 RepID=UPI002C375B1D|nr:DUF4268 domain-containing protein [Amycolatopsis sp.]HVV12015.1 DUF4268 domain-containing protein [Amycolatopsis sp.]
MPLREVWLHEARDFTPWLLANADALGEALDMDLAIAAAEHPVGDFSLDLVGTDLRTDERVIIENQLEATDHSHLGQLLTYAAGTDAVNVVWVAKEFREEHRAALDWLNARTDPDTRFFGIEVSAVRIGGSLPAPLFRVTAQPNDWGKSVRTRTHSHDGNTTDRNLLYAEFWDRYLDALREAGLPWTRARKGPQQNWLPAPSGVSYVDFTVSFGRQGPLSEIYFGHPEPEVNTKRFNQIMVAREKLETTYGTTLSFEPLDGRKGCRIGDRRAGSIINQPEWPTYIEWFIDSQRRLRSAVAAVGGIP